LVVKLKAYRLANGYKQEFSAPILICNGSIGNNVFETNLSYAELQTINGEYGLLYRRITAANGAKAIIIELINATGSGRIRTSGWTSTPTLPLTAYRYNPVAPIIANEDENIDVSSLLLEDDVEITRQIESLDKFDLRVSRASFTLHESDELATFLNKYWNPNGYLLAEYMLGVEIEGEFWGFSDWENVNYDAIEKNYFVDAYDPIKWLQKNIWSQGLPTFGVNRSNLTNFLTYTCGLFFWMGKSLNIDIGSINQNWNGDYVGGYDSETNTYYDLREHLTITDMLVELFKHYSATLYYDESGNLNFVTRNQKNAATYDETVMLEELNKSYQGTQFSGLLINVTSNGTDWTAEQWALVWEWNGELQSIIINANLNNIPKNFNYLDLRQLFPDYTFTYKVFRERTKEEVYRDYKELMRNSAIYETTLDGVVYRLYDTLSVGGDEYVINYAQTSYKEENTKVRVHRAI